GGVWGGRVGSRGRGRKLRPGTVRLLYCARRWHRRLGLSLSRGLRRRQGGHDGRAPCRRWQATPGAGAVPGSGRDPMRLLYAGLRADDEPTPQGASGPGRRRDPALSFRQSLPLRRLSGDRQSSQTRGRQDPGRQNMTAERKPVAFGALRGWIAALRAAGELHEIGAEVDPNIELGTIMRLAQGPGTGRALLFNNIKGYNKSDSRCRRIFGSALNNYARIAMLLGLPPQTPPRELV